MANGIEVISSLEVTPTPEVNPTIELHGTVNMGSHASENNAEAWAVGQRGGEDVPSTDPTYHNSAAYWASQAHGIAVADTYRLMADMLPGTTQEITFDANGNVQKIEHKAGAIVEREDAFTFGTDTITEVRTLDTGDVLTIVTNTETLITTVTVTAAA